MSSTRVHVQTKATDRDKESARHWHGDARAGGGPTTRSVTQNVQRVGEESTKYPGKGMLHNFFLDDPDFRRT